MNPKLMIFCLTVLLAGAATAADFDINQSGFTWSPDMLNIEVGDTVHWNWADGIHTVTSGGGPGDPDAGDLFDAPLDSGNTTFSYTFNAAGTYSYFCRPHFTLGMTGTIMVEDTVAAEATTWGGVKQLFR